MRKFCSADVLCSHSLLASIESESLDTGTWNGHLDQVYGSFLTGSKRIYTLRNRRGLDMHYGQSILLHVKPATQSHRVHYWFLRAGGCERGRREKPPPPFPQGVSQADACSIGKFCLSGTPGILDCPYQFEYPELLQWDAKHVLGRFNALSSKGKTQARIPNHANRQKRLQDIEAAVAAA